MSIDLIELGQSIGEAQATAEAALETAQLAEVETALAAAADAGESMHCGEDCPCRSENRELQAALAALSDKYDEDMDVISNALELLLNDGLEEDEAPEESTVELIRAEEEANTHGSEPAVNQPEPEGHTGTGTGSNGTAGTEPHTETTQEHQHKRRPAASNRIGFRRGR